MAYPGAAAAGSCSMFPSVLAALPPPMKFHATVDAGCLELGLAVWSSLNCTLEVVIFCG